MKELVVISGKGRTGKASIVAAFAGLAKNAVFADCDVDAADLHLILEPRVKYTADFSGGEYMAKQMGVPFLGQIPIDPQIVQSCDAGQPYVYHCSKSQTAKAFERVSNLIIELDNNS